tara:strand:- start:144 stop:1010 length:867 start_codon:yes stop_codon:yes gene_type:complete
MIIWLASYPKSGNTWVRTIINELIFRNNDAKDVFNEASTNIRQFPQYTDFEKPNNFYNEERTEEVKKKLIEDTIKNWLKLQNKINSDKKIKLFKTHNLLGKFNINGENYSFTDLENTIGVIHIVRDPRSIITSLKNHFSLNTEDEAKKMIIDKNTWSGLKIKKTVPNYFSSWSNHYNSWKRFPKNNLLLKYEEILKDPENQIYKIGVYLQNFFKFEFSDEKIKNIANKTSFSNFKKVEEAGKFYEKTEKGKKFFFLGPNNVWKEILKKETVNEIEKEFWSEMKELSYI